MKSQFSFAHLPRVAAVAGAVAFALAAASACGGSTSSAAPSSSSASGATPFTLVLPWYAAPEGGGFFAAKAEGLYKGKNLDVTLQPGGPQVSATQLVAAGRAQIGFTRAPRIVQAPGQGLPIGATGAPYQDNPVGAMVPPTPRIPPLPAVGGTAWGVQTGE